MRMHEVMPVRKVPDNQRSEISRRSGARWPSARIGGSVPSVRTRLRSVIIRPSSSLFLAIAWFHAVRWIISMFRPGSSNREPGRYVFACARIRRHAVRRQLWISRDRSMAGPWPDGAGKGVRGRAVVIPAIAVPSTGGESKFSFKYKAL